MSKLRKALILTAAVAGAAVPMSPALADDNPCKGQAPGPHCRPPCTYTPMYDLGDPANGIGPTVWIEQGGC